MHFSFTVNLKCSFYSTDSGEGRSGSLLAEEEPSSLTIHPVASLPPIRFDPTCVMAPKALAPTLINPEIFPLIVLIRLSKSSVTTVRSFPVFLSRYTDNSALLVVCQFLDKFSAILWGAIHPFTLTFTSFLSYEIFPRSKRVFKTNSSEFLGRSGRGCDRLKLERFVLLFPLHHKSEPFSPSSSSIVAVMLCSSPGVRLFPSLQRITTIFFSVDEKRNWKLVYYIYPRNIFFLAQQITKTKNLNQT